MRTRSSPNGAKAAFSRAALYRCIIGSVLTGRRDCESFGEAPNCLSPPLRAPGPGAIFVRQTQEAPMAVATQNPLNIPGPPTFATVAEERQHRKQRLAAAFRLFSRFGFDEGVAGHITARDPEHLD